MYGLRFVLIVFLNLFFMAQALHAHTGDYSTKFWLWTSSTQIQIINNQTHSSLIMFLTYDATKQFLSSYEIAHLGTDPLLEEIRSPKEFIKIRNFISSENTLYIGLHGPRFASVNNEFTMPSIFGEPNLKNRVRLATKSQKELDIFLIKTLIYNLFKDSNNYSYALNTTHTKSCRRYLK